MEKVKRHILRPEARPLHWSRLNESQKNAFQRILEALEEACGDVDNETGHDYLAPTLPVSADRLRSTRLMFLSGQRGTGKSTVLISLFHAFKPTASRNTGNQANESQPAENQEVKRQNEIVKILNTLKDRIVWLEPLDMEPLPRPTNLLAAILARVDDAVSRSTRVDKERPRAPGLLNLADGEKALHELRTLASDVAIAWDGNVEARAGALDPDAYAVEVTRIEEARLRLNQRLDNTLDRLAKELSRVGEVNNPIFVLPVDDYDLNPLRALDLLHLLRMVSSPRLFILVLGDVRTAEMVFNLKKSGEFATVLQHARNPDYLSLSPDEIASMAHSLSGHAIRKLVPPGQRLELGNMTVWEALEFHPAALAPATQQDTEVSTLKTLLEKLPVEVETAAEKEVETAAEEKGKSQDNQPTKDSKKELAPAIGDRTVRNFREFLLFDLLQDQNSEDHAVQDKKQEAHTSQGKKPAAHPYTGAILLKATPRYIADLWFSLNDLVGQRTGLPQSGNDEWRELLNKLIERLGQEAHRAVEEDSLLSIRYRERFVDALGIGPNEGWLQAMNFVEARSISVPGRQVAFRDHGCVLNANYQRSWMLWDLGERRAIDIDERTKALLILLHDLLALEKGGGIIGAHALSPDSLRLDWAYASWDVGLAEDVKVQWITPAWTSFWEFDQFSHIWQEALHSQLWNELSDESIKRAFLAYVWIAAALKILGDEATSCSLPILIPTSESQFELTSPLWDQLDKALAALARAWKTSSGARADRILSLLTRLPVFLAPESGFMVVNQRGVMKKLAESAFKNNDLKEVWGKEGTRNKQNITKVRRLRADRLAPFIGTEQLEEFLRKDHVINTLGRGIFRPTPTDLDEAKRRAIQRNAISSQDRMAAALEDFSSTLRQYMPKLLQQGKKPQGPAPEDPKTALP